MKKSVVDEKEKEIDSVAEQWVRLLLEHIKAKKNTDKVPFKAN